MKTTRFNSAATSDTASSPKLRTRRYQATPAEIAQALRTLAPQLKRWRYIGYDRSSATIHMEHDTPIITFTDDILLRMRGEGELTTVSGESRSRVGSYDFGVNARNLRAILGALDRVLKNVATAPPAE